MDRWLHVTIDLLTLGESNPEIHRIKDSPSQIPKIGPKHRVIQHSNWKEWARTLNLNANGPGDVLEAGLAERLLGEHAYVPVQQVPKNLHQALLDCTISIGHEAFDEMWSQWDIETRLASEIWWAGFVIDDARWPTDMRVNREFRKLQSYVRRIAIPRIHKKLRHYIESGN